MSIYDRSLWPEPSKNPLVLLFERDTEWFSNAELLTALGYTSAKKSLISQWPTLAEQLGDQETAIAERGMLFADSRRQPRGGGIERYFSRKAMVLIAMRAQTINAAAFCDWVADELAESERLERRMGVL